MPALLTGIVLFVAFHALGLGAALRLRARLDLPPRFLAALVTAASSLVSYGIFWIAMLWPGLRSPAIAAALLASVVLTLVTLNAGHEQPVRALRGGVTPSMAAALLCLVWLSPLLPNGPEINDRLAWRLPSDNILPALFARRVVLGESVRPPVPPLWPGGDRASERPPLQAAVVVGLSPLLRGTNVHEYQIAATICQAQWLPALWLVGVTCGLRGRRLAFVLTACALSGFFFINTVYTWPKLFAASLMLGALAIAMEPPAADANANRARVIVVFASCTLALLAHPGPVFTLLAVPVCWPILRPIVRLRWTWPAITAGAALSAALVAPWLAYQALVDPPTNRLLREHLADGRADGTVAHAIVAANLARPIGEHVRIRLGNLAAQLGDPIVALWPFPWQHAQQEQFFHHGASLGLLLIGLAIVILARPRTADPALDTVRRLAILALVALLIWSVLVFPERGALIHHGSPVTTALLFFTGAYGITRLPWPVQLIAMILHGAAFVLIWLVPILGAAYP